VPDGDAIESFAAQFGEIGDNRVVSAVDRALINRDPDEVTDFAIENEVTTESRVYPLK
jgi:hypothetical protein